MTKLRISPTVELEIHGSNVLDITYNGVQIAVVEKTNQDPNTYEWFGSIDGRISGSYMRGTTHTALDEAKAECLAWIRERIGK